MSPNPVKRAKESEICRYRTTVFVTVRDLLVAALETVERRVMRSQSQQSDLVDSHSLVTLVVYAIVLVVTCSVRPLQNP